MHSDNPLADQVGGNLIPQSPTGAAVPAPISSAAPLPPIPSVKTEPGQRDFLPGPFGDAAIEGSLAQLEENSKSDILRAVPRQPNFYDRTGNTPPLTQGLMPDAPSATPVAPGVNEFLQSRLREKYQPNHRSRSIASERLGDGSGFDRLRAADAARKADHVMPTAGNVMRGDLSDLNSFQQSNILASRARSRERRGTPDPGTPEADQLFRDQRQRRRDRSEANMPIRQYRAMMQNQQELAPVTFGGQGTPYTNVARRFNQGPGLMERTLAATRMVRGDRLQDEKIDRDRFVNDRDFGERQRQFNENTALAQGRLDFETKNAADINSLNAKREENRHLVATGQLSIDEGRANEEAINNEHNRLLADSKNQREQEAHDQAMDSTSSVNKLTQMESDRELEDAKFADAGVTDNYSSGPLRHSEQSVVQMQQALTDPNLSKEEKTEILRKRYGIYNQKQLNVYLRDSGYEENHAFSWFGSEDGTQGSALNPLNWFNWYQSGEVDETRDTIQGASPLR